jgi:hypothetical protein
MRPATDSQHEWKGDQDVRVTSSKASSKEWRRELYPPIECEESGWLEVSELHSLYWEVSGNPDGQVRISCGQRKKKGGTKNQTVCANGTVRAALVGEGEEEVSF